MRKTKSQTTSTSTLARRIALSSRRGRMAALFILVILVASVAAISIVSAAPEKAGEKEPRASALTLKTQAERGHREREEKERGERAFAQEQGNLNVSPTAQTRPVPVLTMENVPDVPQCRNILNQDILDLANASEDPGEVFEANRREHPHMIEMPPPVECASELWQEVRNPARAPAVPELINTRAYSLDAVYNMNALAASIGTNTDPSSGVEGYQGENSISIDPNNPQHIIAHSNTFFRDTTPQCQSPTGGAALTFGTMALFGSSDGGQNWAYNCAPWHTSVTGGVA